MMQYVIQEGVQGICPDGWHIPTDEEWKQLEGEVDSQYGYPDPEWDNEGFRGFDVGKNLKSTTGWTFGGNGIDSFGFNALPAGTYNPTWMFSSIEYDGLWWLSSGGYTYAWDRDISNNHDNVLRVHTSSMEEGHSVRCLKD